MTTAAGHQIVPRPAAAAPALRAADQGVADALESVLAGNTRRVYGAQWRLFTGWCDDVGLQWMSADRLTVARYLAVRAGTAALDTSPVADEAVHLTANAAWLAVQVMAYNLARWTARIGLGEPMVTTKTLRRQPVFALAGRLTRSARRLTLHLPLRWPCETQFNRALARLRSLPA